eukprot:s1742_g3.t1
MPQVLPSVGELLTCYEDSGDGVSIRWCVDLRRMASQYRYGTSRRFAVQLADAAEEVPFVVFFNPAAAEEATPVFVANNLRATLQVKCTDPALISTLLDVRFDVEGLHKSHLCKAHNFRVEPLCLAQGAAWPLQGCREALVKLELRPALR